MTTDRDQLREVLRQARDYLLEVGNDYPGSSCQKWCTEKAREVWNAVNPWRHCPSTHCERTKECRSVNECSANNLGGTRTDALAEARTSNEYHQKRGMLADAVDALATNYDDFMTDDRFDAWEMLHKLGQRLRELREFNQSRAALSRLNEGEVK